MTALPPEKQRRRQFMRWLTLFGYFGLILLHLNWHTWYLPPEQVPRSLILIAVLVPLLLPLRGLLHARPYTHAWASMLSLPYFGLGVDTAFNRLPPESWLGLAEVFLSLCMFTGCVLFVHFGKTGKKGKKSKETKQEDSQQEEQ